MAAPNEFMVYDENPLSCYRSPPGASLLFRALRPDELFTLFEKNALLPPCNPCPGQPCCDITPSQHVTSGSKALVKSSWISTTKSPGVAALWASATIKDDGNVVRLKGDSSSGVFAVINSDGLDTYDPTEDLTIGVTGRNAAKKSEEILIKDMIPLSNIIGLCQATQVKKPEYLSWPGGKISGARTGKSSKLFVIWGPIKDIPDVYFKDELLSKFSSTLRFRKSRKSRKVSRKSRKVSRKSRKVSRKSRKVSRKSRKVSRKSRKVSRKSRKVSRKSRKVSRKSRKVSRKSRKVSRKSRKVSRKL